MLSIAGFIFFFILFTYLLYRFTRNKPVTLSAAELTLAFGCKVLFGCLYGYIFLRFYGGDDTWWIHNESLSEYKELFRDPALFIRDFTPYYYLRDADSWWQGLGMYSDSLEKQLTIKPPALFNIFSRGNYYINVIFFNFFFFQGHYLLFSLLAKEFPQQRRNLFLLIFLFPPVLFWLSGIRGDGWIFLFTVLLLVYFNRWLQQQRTRHLLVAILSFFIVLIFRNLFALLLVPALLAWAITVKGNIRPVWAFTSVYALMMLLFFGSTLLPGKANLTNLVVKRQQEYFSLQGNTRFALDSLQPAAGSFVKVAPQAIQNTFLRPYIWEAKGILQQVSALDIVFFLLLTVLFVIRRRKPPAEYFKNPFILVLCCFSLSFYLFIGFIVPFPGAIVRYKVITELFLLIILLLNIRWSNHTLYKK